MIENLHAFNPVTQKTLSLWYDKYQWVWRYFVKPFIWVDLALFWLKKQPSCIYKFKASMFTAGEFTLDGIHPCKVDLCLMALLICSQRSPCDRRGGLPQQKRPHRTLRVSDDDLLSCWSRQENPQQVSPYTKKCYMYIKLTKEWRDFTVTPPFISHRNIMVSLICSPVGSSMCKISITKRAENCLCRSRLNRQIFSLSSTLWLCWWPLSCRSLPCSLWGTTPASFPQ